VLPAAPSSTAPVCSAASTSIDSGDMATGHDYDPNTGAGGANGTTIANLVIQNCNGHGISANGHGYIFNNNFIGTDVAGVTAVLNKGAGISISASRVYSNQSNMLLQNLFNSFPVQPLDNSQISVSPASWPRCTAMRCWGRSSSPTMSSRATSQRDRRLQRKPGRRLDPRQHDRD
jgi:hypothetical protein